MLDLARIRAMAAEQTDNLLNQSLAPAVSRSPSPVAKKFPFILPGQEPKGPEIEYLIEGLLPVDGLGAFYGAPSQGKTWTAVDVACHIAAGKPYFNRQVLGGGVVYIAAEAGRGILKRRKAWMIAHGYSTLPLAVISTAPDLGSRASAEATDLSDLVRDMKLQVPYLGEPLRLIVIDTLARVMPYADENSGQAMGTLIRNVAELASNFDDCLVVLVHHTGKNGSAGLRGHSSLHGATDVEWLISSSGDQKKVVLQKIKEATDRLSWTFALETVADDGATSCVVRPLTLPAKSDGEGLIAPTGNDGIVFAAVAEAIEEFGASSQVIGPEEGPTATREQVHQLAKFRGIGDPNNPKSQAAIVNRSIRSLEKQGTIGVSGDIIWLKRE